jgi:hypothetical protein
MVLKNIYLGFFKFYQPKATSGGFLIFEWILETRNFGYHFSVTSRNCQRDIQNSNFEIYFLLTSIACQSKSSQTVKLKLKLV